MIIAVRSIRYEWVFMSEYSAPALQAHLAWLIVPAIVPPWSRLAVSHHLPA